MTPEQRDGQAQELQERYQEAQQLEQRRQGELRYTLNEQTIDLQLGYDFPESSSLSGLSVLFQVNNLTNEPFRTEVSESTGTGLLFPEEYTEYGRQYLLGFRYKL